MGRNIVVTQATGQYVDDLPVEIVERKGIGHPDSLCDGMAEAISREYTRWCEENLGVLLHHNFDKVQLVAGETDVHFGGGVMIKPIRIQIAGRGTAMYQGRRIPMESIAIRAARDYLSKTMRYLDPVEHVVIDCYAGRGSTELASAVHHIEANDTSFGVSHWPRSGLEQLVYETAQYLNYELIDQFPIGEDVKVMGYRQGKNVVLTCAVPFIASRVHDATEYLEAKRGVQAAVQAFAEKQSSYNVQADVNTADRDKRGDFYLTLTGTSAECGDDGAVGRGNRLNGVIAPFRAASLEAPCGKNPISHVGKIYNALAFQAAQAVVEQVPQVRSATIYLLSQIGKPLDQPLVCTAQVFTDNGDLSPQVEEAVRAVLDDQLAHVDEIGVKIRRGELPLF